MRSPSIDNSAILHRLPELWVRNTPMSSAAEAGRVAEAVRLSSQARNAHAFRYDVKRAAAFPQQPLIRARERQ